ncbi:golgin subfamily A member 2 [Drosophila pseudoobscura]|uniref:Golgin subfamily A member 2 n=1 Tax=Drosophila pseudoobscura pseudoobscura TaxID=46245 RepID=A0A6I8V777_DROPS|nr:golgin subfamily A member 2 [Drosophila pseudoobscura]
MPDDTHDAKALKLAAARKKLKEYQQRNNNHAGGDEQVQTGTHSSTVSIASNLSERSDSEVNVNENGGGGSSSLHVRQQSEEAVSLAALPTPTAAALFTQPEPDSPIFAPNGAPNESNLQAIQVIIAEKAQLNAELTRARVACRERELELEELRTEQGQTRLRLEQLQQHCQGQQAGVEQQRHHNAQLLHKLTESQAQIVDQQSHLLEMEAQLKQLNLRQDELQRQLAEKSSELEMAELKLRQLSDESNINADNRVESLTQTQYMYEQQIRDLQAMVGQLTQDKEQASGQYQNYVQHQNSEIAKLNEKNSELTEELLELRERERQLVEHVSGLERDIQKNLSLQAQFKEASQPQTPAEPQIDQTTLTTELAALKERLSDFDFERHEFQLKIKSQDDQLHVKEAALAEMEQQLDRLQAEQPDQSKLLATMESDKVAASRALTQNVEMKQQLDELEQKFVQLTNDKAELVIRLDAEEFANREIRHNYDSMEQKLLASEERFKFKDEEMIRLSHENVELQRQQLMLKQQLDRLQHYEVKAYHSQAGKQPDETGEPEESETKDHHEHHSHDHLHDHDHGDHSDGHSHDHSHDHVHQEHHQLSPGSLPTAEAVERLQARFTTLISQVADLTEEKHSLEHLVLQLQGETETIGEYIALYQTQRRMLKQREYEKATQMRLLQAEREQLREKIEALNKLVASLGVELPTDQVQGQPQTVALQDTPSEQERPLTQTPSNEDSNGENSQQILNKIQNIISEIKENTEQPTTVLSGHPVDHLNCCLGKFEVV